MLTGKVVKLITGAVSVEQIIDISGGLQVVAIIAGESVKSLKLVVGTEVTALFKASSVVVGA